MESNAKRAFDENCKDIERLLEFHQEVGGEERGRRYGLEVLNKSAVILLCSFWEAYCEDIAAEGISHLVEHASSAQDLSDDIKKKVAKDIKGEQNELAVWFLADDDWRSYLNQRLEKLKIERNRVLNTPNTKNINDFFNKALGIEQISQKWYWKKMPKENSTRKLDEFIELRGTIAHRGKLDDNSVKKEQVIAFLKHIQTLVSKIDREVFDTVTRSTGREHW
jgi:hypothetical protein